MRKTGGAFRRCSVLVASGRRDLLTEVGKLAGRDFAVTPADGPEAALAELAAGAFDLLLADHAMRPLSGLHLLGWARRHARPTVGVLLTEPAGLEEAARAVGRGDIFGYAALPLRADGLMAALTGAARQARRQRLREPLQRRLRREGEQFRARRMILLERLVESLNRDVDELEEEGRWLRRRSLEMEQLARTDPLTQLPNRRAIEEIAEYEVRRRSRQPGPLAVGIVDADRFKEINTRHLHPGGDLTLVGLARTLAGALRTTDRVGRLGGEELLVVAPQTDADGAGILGERLRAAVEQMSLRYNGQSISLTISIGFAVVGTGERTDYRALLDAAASALAEAKESGRNRTVVRAIGAHQSTSR